MKEGILKNTLVGHFDKYYWCLRPVICLLFENSLMFWDLNAKPENLDLASVLILWVLNQSPFPLSLVSPFVKMKGPYSFDSAHILIHREPNGTPWNSSLEPGEKQRRDDELVVHLPAPQWRQVINSVMLCKKEDSQSGKSMLECSLQDGSGSLWGWHIFTFKMLRGHGEGKPISDGKYIKAISVG